MNIFTPIWISLLVAAIIFAICGWVIILTSRRSKKKEQGEHLFSNKDQGFQYAGFKNETKDIESVVQEPVTEPIDKKLEPKVETEYISNQDDNTHDSNPNAAKNLLVASALLQVLSPSGGNNQSSRSIFGGPASNGAHTHSLGFDQFGASGSNNGRSHSKYASRDKKRFNAVLLSGGIDTVDGGYNASSGGNDTGGDGGGCDAAGGTAGGTCDA